MEDNFNEREDYLVQLASKLLSVTPMQLNVKGFGLTLAGYMVKEEIGWG